jgi:hypothetical protein
MKFEVYCDEANPDVLTSKHARARYLMIGGLWVRADLRQEIKTRIWQLRQKHNTWGEIKWSKVSPARQAFYLELVDLFIELKTDLRFRCIAVDSTTLKHELHNNDGELGFYKFYYQLLRHWIIGSNDYAIFCDIKSNRDPKRLPVLERCLARANSTYKIQAVQSLPSHEVVLIQLCDLLLGAASSRLNESLKRGSAKEAIVAKLETGLGRPLMPSFRSENKFNIFKIHFREGR